MGCPMLKTRFTEMLGLRYPVMSAPMSNHSGGRLAAAVCQAGGLGTFGGSNNFGAKWFAEQIGFIRSQTDRPFGVGFITHLIESNPDNFETALAEKVPVIIFSFADPRPWLPRARDTGAITICQVQTPASCGNSAGSRRGCSFGPGQRGRRSYRRNEPAAPPCRSG